MRVVARVEIDEVEQVLLAIAGRAPRRGDHALEVEGVGVDQQMHEGLKVVEIGPANIGRHDHARAGGLSGGQSGGEN